MRESQSIPYAVGNVIESCEKIKCQKLFAFGYNLIFFSSSPMKTNFELCIQHCGANTQFV